ncbi:MAG: ABC transporter substrate binding protein [Thiotrichaceae bacterium]|nr:ABC transporter substrate binding protein [Thiotrichaceae bacterium]
MRLRFIKILLGVLLLGNIANTWAVDNLYTGKRVYYVASYHQGYPWSDSILKTIQEVFADQGIIFEHFEMDTKRNPSIEYSKNIALQAKAKIEQFHPDLLLVSDDNAMKYLVEPYFNGNLPVVFCGVNWDVSEYHFNRKMVTGMVEVELIDKIVHDIKEYAHGNRIGFIGMDGYTERKLPEYFNSLFQISLNKTYYVKNFEEWKLAYLKAQQEVDMLLIHNPDGLPQWDSVAAKQFVEENTQIPSGTSSSFTTQFALIGIIRLPEEQGRWAAETALKVLRGEPINHIPFTSNKQGNLVINMRLGNKLKITFKSALLKTATILH